MAKTKIALFGGTFDPIHIGHTIVADAACESIGAEKVVFIPAKRSPLKHLSPHAGDDHRYAMAALAIAGNDKFELSDYELTGPVPSYTLETVRYFKSECDSKAEFYWLVGADGIEDLLHWYGILELLDECNLSVMYRAGFDKPDFSGFADIWGRQRIEKLRANVVRTPLVDISSTEIRRRITAGRPIDDMVHPGVAEYIREHHLYK